MRKTTAVLGLLALGGCALPPPDEPVKTLQGPVPFAAVTPATDALACLAEVVRATPTDLRLAVGDIPDRTGRFDYEEVGSFVTQGATYMMVAAVAQAGVRQVNRSTIGIAEWELQQALSQRLGEGRPLRVGQQTITYRPVPRGAFLGSTHYVTGAITELDFNVFQRSNEVAVGGIGFGGRSFAAQVALDLMVTDTRTTEVVLSRSYRKQIVGYEVRADVFRIFDIGGGVGQIDGDELIEVSFADQPNEPLQGSVRWAVEAAAYDIAARLLGAEDRCDGFLTPSERERRAAARAAARPIPAPPPPVDDPLETTDPSAGPAAGSLPAPSATPLDCRVVAGRTVCAPFPDTAPPGTPGSG